MDRDEVLTALCALARKVNEQAFQFRAAADCFCETKPFNFQFDPAVLEFIREAVDAKLATVNAEAAQLRADAMDRARYDET